MTVVEQIHADFDNAQEQILQEAIEIIEANKVGDKDRIQLMKELGFINVESVKIAQKKLNRQVESKEMADLVMYYQQTYPFLKFLTESKLDEICERYNLIYAPVQSYTEEVPQKNLLEIANSKEILLRDIRLPIYKFKHCDSAYKDNSSIIKFLKETEFEINISRVGQEDKVAELYEQVTGQIFDRRWAMYWRHNSTFEEVKLDGLFIAAPKSHFDLSKLSKIKKHGFFQVTKIQSEPPDPIVFRYVKGGIQVLSKWGPEAEDQDLVQGILN